MRYLYLILLSFTFFSCKKIGPKHCYECSTTRTVAGQIRTIEQCGTEKEIEEVEHKGYKYTVSVNGNQTTEIIPLVCVQKD